MSDATRFNNSLEYLCYTEGAGLCNEDVHCVNISIERSVFGVLAGRLIFIAVKIQLKKKCLPRVLARRP